MAERLFHTFRQWVKERNRTKSDQSLSYFTVARLLLWPSEHWLLFLSCLLFLAIALSLAFAWIATNFFCYRLPPLWNTPAEAQAYYSTLWTLQATIAAMVYPIVTSFVAVLLQRRSATSLTLTIYYQNAGVMPAGGSAIALLIWMGIQFFFLPYSPIPWIAAAMFGNTVWLIINFILTGLFLYRTVRFVHDGERLQVFNRYAVQVAFPREIQNVKSSQSLNAPILTSSFFEEIVGEILALAEQKRYDAARELVHALSDLHSDLVSVGSYVNEKGEHLNRVLSQSSNNFWSQTIHDVWLNIYRGIAKKSVELLADDPNLFRRHCYLAHRLILRLPKDQPCELPINYLLIETQLMYELGDWWSLKVEERGLAKHNALRSVTLSPPNGAHYEKALQYFIGGWEQTKIYDEANPTTPEESWQYHAKKAQFVAAKAEKTAEMFLDAVARGDRSAASWFWNCYLNLWESHFGPRPYRGDTSQNHLVTFACIDKKWLEVRKLLDEIPDGQMENRYAEELMRMVLFRYWSDLRLVLIMIILEWLPDNAEHDVFALEIAVALFQGRDLIGGKYRVKPLNDPQDVLFRLVRMFLADDNRYNDRLNRIVTYAKEIRRPATIPGRVYWSGSDDVNSLSLAQCQVLTAIAAVSEKQEISSILARTLSKWSHDLEKLQRCKTFANELAKHIASDEFTNKCVVTAILRIKLGLPDNLCAARDWVHNALILFANKALEIHAETLDQSPVSSERLEELCKSVSNYVLGTGNLGFPFTIKKDLKKRTVPGQPRSLTVEVDKASFTHLENADISGFNWFNEIIAESISAGIIGGYVNSFSVPPLRADSERTFFEDLTEHSRVLSEQGLTPILIVSVQHAPDWVHPWHYYGVDEIQRERPPVRPPKADDATNIIGYFEDIPIVSVQIFEKKCYVIPQEHLSTIYYAVYANGSCIFVSHTPAEGQRINLKFEWSFSLGELPTPTAFVEQITAG